jgi:hypothetical protein
MQAVGGIIGPQSYDINENWEVKADVNCKESRIELEYHITF